MIFLFLTILCSSSIALILKYNETKKGHPVILLNSNYFSASVVSLIIIAFQGEFDFSLGTILFGAFLGLMFFVTFFLFAKSIEVAGTALATVSSRLSVIIPIVFSIILYDEIPSTLQSVGIFFALVTIYLFYQSLKRGSEGKLKIIDGFYLFALLVGIGVNDFCLKIFQNWKPVEEKSIFIFCIFFSAFLFSLIYILLKGLKYKKGPIISGTILGIPNVLSSVFLLAALAAVPGIVVFPVTNIGIILFSSIGAWAIYKETLNNFGKLAILTGIFAMAFLGF